jgi:hypothetical protein
MAGLLPTRLTNVRVRSIAAAQRQLHLPGRLAPFEALSNAEDGKSRRALGGHLALVKCKLGQTVLSFHRH